MELTNKSVLCWGSPPWTFIRQWRSTRILLTHHQIQTNWKIWSWLKQLLDLPTHSTTRHHLCPSTICHPKVNPVKRYWICFQTAFEYCENCTKNIPCKDLVISPSSCSSCISFCSSCYNAKAVCDDCRLLGHVSSPREEHQVCPSCFFRSHYWLRRRKRTDVPLYKVFHNSIIDETIDPGGHICPNLEESR